MQKLTITPTEKKCNICNEIKPISEFYKDRGTSDGFQYSCKGCDKAKSTRWQRESGYNRSHSRVNRMNRKRQAKSFIKGQVKYKKIPPATEKTCYDCDLPANEYHHWSYAKEHWADVIPLCTKCHHARHAGWERFIGRV